ncbi:hypothetical protein GTO89_16770 [Heliobacterium gestii]|uniref:Uncharacterized protein n=1 Tax=Heliomicrobium gestii TaxID=2699 RepID=A0A845LJC5_HELGE|nr:hypothetical protein [Heliomicrobium gestii]MBM7868515.1 hypothetical protein [Heliomicrobium gestii]MZP44669.1 hypothetical protein [Heliomicrobium gestii]
MNLPPMEQPWCGDVCAAPLIDSEQFRGVDFSETIRRAGELPQNEGERQRLVKMDLFAGCPSFYADGYSMLRTGAFM